MVYNNKEALQRLVNDNSCTYMKSPAGIFTEVTLPIEEITIEHETDSLLSATISFNRLNSGIDLTEYPVDAPSTILMVHKDSLDSFFETKTLYDNTTSYITSLSENAYTFGNISNIITLMAKQKANGLKNDPQWVEKHPNWNKVLLVPVNAITSQSTDAYGYTTTSTIASIANQMGLTSTKLVGGIGTKIELKIIYGKFRTL